MNLGIFRYNKERIISGTESIESRKMYMNNKKFPQTCSVVCSPLGKIKDVMGGDAVGSITHQKAELLCLLLTFDPIRFWIGLAWLRLGCH